MKNIRIKTFESFTNALNEKMAYDDFKEFISPFLDLAKEKGWVWNSSGDSWFDIHTAIALYHKDELPTTKDGEYGGQPTLLGKHPTVANQIQSAHSPLKDKSADVVMKDDMDLGQVQFCAKDKNILVEIKNKMADAEVIQDIKETSSGFISSGDFEKQKFYCITLRKK